MDSATEFLFGDRVNSTHESLLLPGGVEVPVSGSVTPARSRPITSALVRSFDMIQEVFCWRIRIGFSWFAFETFKDHTEEHYDNIRAYLQRSWIGAREATSITERGIGTKEGQKIRGWRRRDTPGPLGFETDDVDIIRDSLINMPFAGRDGVSLIPFLDVY